MGFKDALKLFFTPARVSAATSLTTTVLIAKLAEDNSYGMDLNKPLLFENAIVNVLQFLPAGALPNASEDEKRRAVKSAVMLVRDVKNLYKK